MRHWLKSWTPTLNNTADHVVGISLTTQTISLAVLKQSATPELLDLHAFTIADQNEADQALTQCLSHRRYHHLPCHVVLASDYYRLQQADIPKVPQDERDEALAWSLRDVMEFPVNEALVRSFPFPASVSRSNERVYAVVAHQPRLQQLAQWLNRHHLNVSSFDIPELAFATVLQRVPQRPATSALLCDTARGSAMYLYVGDDLVLSRQLNGISSLSLFDDPQQPVDNDPLLLEIQRTLDFFESQLARRPIQTLFLPPLPTNGSHLQAILKRNLNTAVQSFSPESFLRLAKSVDPQNIPFAFFAIAAALRDFKIDKSNALIDVENTRTTESKDDVHATH